MKHEETIEETIKRVQTESLRELYDFVSKEDLDYCLKNINVNLKQVTFIYKNIITNVDEKLLKESRFVAAMWDCLVGKNVENDVLELRSLLINNPDKANFIFIKFRPMYIAYTEGKKISINCQELQEIFDICENEKIKNWLFDYLYEYTADLSISQTNKLVKLVDKFPERCDLILKLVELVPSEDFLNEITIEYNEWIMRNYHINDNNIEEFAKMYKTCHNMLPELYWGFSESFPSGGYDGTDFNAADFKSNNTGRLEFSSWNQYPVYNLSVLHYLNTSLFFIKHITSHEYIYYYNYINWHRKWDLEQAYLFFTISGVHYGQNYDIPLEKLKNTAEGNALAYCIYFEHNMFKKDFDISEESECFLLDSNIEKDKGKKFDKYCDFVEQVIRTFRNRIEKLPIKEYKFEFAKYFDKYDFSEKELNNILLIYENYYDTDSYDYDDSRAIPPYDSYEFYLNLAKKIGNTDPKYFNCELVSSVFSNKVNIEKNFDNSILNVLVRINPENPSAWYNYSELYEIFKESSIFAITPEEFIDYNKLNLLDKPFYEYEEYKDKVKQRSIGKK